MESLLFRWRGQPELALHRALAAADIYSQSPDSPSSVLALGRVSSAVTETALDLAGSFPPALISNGRAAYVDLARPYVKMARQKAKQTNDTSGLYLATLAQARYDSIAGPNRNRVQAVEGVIRHAQRANDKSLEAQAFTSLGREYTVLGQPETSLSCYRRALDAVVGTEIPAVAVFARRALLLASEMEE
jgi:hypothetical protein